MSKEEKELMKNLRIKTNNLEQKLNKLKQRNYKLEIFIALTQIGASFGLFLFFLYVIVNERASTIGLEFISGLFLLISALWIYHSYGALKAGITDYRLVQDAFADVVFAVQNARQLLARLEK